MNFKLLKKDLEKKINAKTDEIQQLDSQIAQLQEKHDKIKLDPFGARKKKLQGKIDTLTQECDTKKEELIQLNTALSDVIAEEQRLLDNKRFFRGDARKSSPAKVVIGILSGVVAVVAVLFGGFLFKKQLDKNARKIEIGFYSDNLKGKNYSSISSELSEKGFTNIKSVAVEDIDSYINAYNNEVIADVKVNGDTSFIPTDKYLPEDEILITYHVLTPKAIGELETKEKAEEEARLLKEAQEAERIKKEKERKEKEEAELQAKAEEKKREEAEKKAAEEAKRAAEEEARKKAEASQKAEQKPQTPATTPSQTPPPAGNNSSGSYENETADAYEYTVYITKTGKRYHQDPNCGGSKCWQTTLADAKSRGLTPCQKCAK